MSADPGAAAIVGSYRVVSVQRTLEDGTVVQPFGADPDGILIYTADGTTSAVVGASGRPALDLDLIASEISASDADQAAAFRTAHGFAGTYEVAGDTVIHRILFATVQNWVGTEQFRPYELAGDHLTLRPPGWRVVARRIDATTAGPAGRAGGGS